MTLTPNTKPGWKREKIKVAPNHQLSKLSGLVKELKKQYEGLSQENGKKSNQESAIGSVTQ